MVSDVQSYLSAMRYMTAFNDRKDIILYWDEPTITLDYETHDFHEIKSKNRKENLIPNIIFSSATLPNKDRIMSCVQSLQVLNTLPNDSDNFLDAFDTKEEGMFCLYDACWLEK